MKKMLCQMGMILCLLGMMLAVGCLIEGTTGLWGTLGAVTLLLGAQKALGYAAEHKHRRQNSRRRPVRPAHGRAAEKHHLRAA